MLTNSIPPPSDSRPMRLPEALPFHSCLSRKKKDSIPTPKPIKLTSLVDRFAPLRHRTRRRNSMAIGEGGRKNG